jgi:hypothetical protein
MNKQKSGINKTHSALDEIETLLYYCIYFGLFIVLKNK